jgi:hypothetical protein
MNQLCASERSFRSAGVMLVVLALLTVVFMAMHPVSGASGVADFAGRAERGMHLNALVHGVQISLLLLMVPCFLFIADVLGSGRLVVRIGLVLMVLGATGGVAAGLINGFMVPATAARYAGAEPATLEGLEAVLRLCQSANGACARTSVFGLSLAAVIWGSCLVVRPGVARAAGVVGVLSGFVPLALHFAEHLAMDVRGFGLFVVLHAAWAVAAGIVLIRAGRPVFPEQR